MIHSFINLISNWSTGEDRKRTNYIREIKVEKKMEGVTEKTGGQGKNKTFFMLKKAL